MSSYAKTGQGIGRRALVAGAAMLSFPAIRAQAQTAGVALVIGNSKYHWEATLPNVKRDAPDIAKRFQAMGLKTELVQDAGRDAMRRAIDTFAAAARGANFAAFYFAGHGAAWGRDTYLVPVDADLSNPNTVGNLIPVASVSTGIEAAANRLMVFDNCRNNPADGWRQREAELAAIAGRGLAGGGPPNTLILYSTAPGRVALDGPAGDNSPFAAALMRQLEGPSVDLQALPAKLRRELLIATRGRQVLWSQNSYAGPFVLKGAPGRTAAAGSGWASDPSKIIELNGAFAFAQQNGLPLPAGLIAHRPAANAPHSHKVGSYKYTAPVPGGGIVPGILVVMSVEEQEGAEVIMATTINGQVGWRFVRSKISNDTLDCVPSNVGAHFFFRWSDATSGSLNVELPRRATGSTAGFNSRFTRLDG